VTEHVVNKMVFMVTNSQQYITFDNTCLISAHIYIAANHSYVTDTNVATKI